MPRTIKPIETYYHGYRFRSRLEARWAVYFDQLGVKYQYEPEGIDMDGVWYLPDFLLTDFNVYVEVKSETDLTFDQKKCGGDLYKIKPLFAISDANKYYKAEIYLPTHGYSFWLVSGDPYRVTFPKEFGGEDGIRQLICFNTQCGGSFAANIRHNEMMQIFKENCQCEWDCTECGIRRGVACSPLFCVMEDIGYVQWTNSAQYPCIKNTFPSFLMVSDACRWSKEWFDDYYKKVFKAAAISRQYRFDHCEKHKNGGK